MGSATFALPSLNALFDAGYPIAAVITQPDKPTGRGQSLQGPPVKKRAFDLHLPVHQPPSLKTDQAHQLFEALVPDLIVVVAYGKILPTWLLQLPKYGCLNLHGSLLPKYRGAAPVHWAIANGEERTGDCTMLLDEGLDTGDVYLCEETPIGADETTPELYDRLARIGAPLLLKTIEGIVGGNLKPKVQDHAKATFAPVLKKADGFLNWARSASEIHNRVRAFNPWPGAVVKFREHVCKILKTNLSIVGSHRPPLHSEAGEILVTKGQLVVACGDGNPIEILLIQPANRKAISGCDFANGLRLQPGEKFQTVMDN